MSRHVILDAEGNDITDEYFKDIHAIGVNSIRDSSDYEKLEAKPAEELFDELLNGDDPKMSCRETVLDEAKRCICQDRQNQYGAPEDSFQVIANLWTSYLGGCNKLEMQIDPEDVALMMVLLKVARTIGHTHHVDNYVDMAGYAALAAELAEDELCIPEI